jgi:crotonobetainyl-CoA:carnitine CoA-transferase CaiB-like acyl-CoA transferase
MLTGIRVLDFASQVAGPYCSKLFVDAGAHVIKVEAPEGDSLRRFSATGADLGGADSAFFAYLNAGKQSVVGRPEDPHVRALLAEADLVIEAHGLATDDGTRLDVATLRAAHPAVVILSITPYGRAGPWAERAATEFTLQAEAGSIGIRGLMGHEPIQAGGRITEFAGASYGAVAALVAVLHARATGRGEHVDLSLLEAGNLVFTNYGETMNRLMNGGPGDPEHYLLAPSVETPSIERTADGYVGFCTNARQQFMDFLLLIERPDLREDEQLAQFAGRLLRFAEWSEIMDAWLSKKKTAEVLELASELRIPVAPILNGETVLQHEQLVERRVFVPDASGRFVQPRRPYRFDDADPPPPGPAPRLGEHTETAAFPSRERPAPTPTDALPLAGLRIVDLTAWWAGPAATHLFATFGAEVVHVESTSRIDGLRSIGGVVAGHFPDWWEASPHFMHVNTNKLGITLDLTQKKGRELLDRLIAQSDVVIENFTPRVLEQFGLSWERIQALNPRAILMRMPAFGLSGPWRDNTGFAQTMEQMTGLAWVTGHADDQPRIPRGPCDPIAAMHAAFTLLVALAQREATGRGLHVESTMVESALNIAAEQVLEWSAYGRRMERMGNRSVHAAPQGLYECAEGVTVQDKWLALSIPSDAEWRALREVLGEPAWAMDPALDTAAGRHAAHDAIDAALSAWTAGKDRAALLAALRARDIPASEVDNPGRLLGKNPQLAARHYFERPGHPVMGEFPLPSLPFRFSGVERWLRTPAPTLGRDNDHVLRTLLGVSPEALRELEAEGVIGTRPARL